jgi:hypothetical protein
MGLTELLPLLHRLSRAEKLHVMQFLVSELVQEESDLLKPSMAYPVWSPYDAHEAADAMLEVLKAAETGDRA